MKIKNEFPILLKNSDLRVFKLGKLSNKVKINTVQFKKENNYLELEIDLPKQNISLVRNKTDNMILQSFGVEPITSLYLLNDNLCYKLNSSYKFNTKFVEQDAIHKNIQFRKVESREEVEHRKRNINYKFKLLENETFTKLEYKNTFTTIKEKKENNIRNDVIYFDLTKIEKCIKNRIVVNFSDLLKLFPGQNENIKLCLQRLTFYFKGRYILKNKFYDKKLQEIRNAILNENFDKIEQSEDKKNMIEQSEDLKNMIEQSEDLKNMINELCINDKLDLKGYYEDLEIDYKNTNLVKHLKEKLVFTLQDIKMLSGLEMEDVYKFVIENNLIEIINNFYCVEINKEIQEIIEIYKLESIKKSEIVEIVKTKDLDVECFFKIFEHFFVLKRSTWTRK